MLKEVKYGHLGIQIKYERPSVRPSAAFKKHIKVGFRYFAILEKPATGFVVTFRTVVW